MAGLIKTHLQLGDSTTASQNFTLTAAQQDGTMRLYQGNAGTPIRDILTVPLSGPAKFAGTQQLAQLLTFQTGAVATGTTIIPIDDTIPQITEGNEYLALTITPVNALSTLEIDTTIYVGRSIVDWLIGALFQDATANALAVAVAYSSTATGVVPLTMKHIMVAGTTVATTFRVRAGGANAGTLTLNGSNGVRHFGGTYASRITIKEYLP